MISQNFNFKLKVNKDNQWHNFNKFLNNNKNKLNNKNDNNSLKYLNYI